MAGLACCRGDRVHDPLGPSLTPVSNSSGQSLPAAMAAEVVRIQNLAHLAERLVACARGCPPGLSKLPEHRDLRNVIR